MNKFLLISLMSLGISSNMLGYSLCKDGGIVHSNSNSKMSEFSPNHMKGLLLPGLNAETKALLYAEKNCKGTSFGWCDKAGCYISKFYFK